MAEMCNEGTEYACSALSSEEAAKLAWLAKQDVASPGSKVAAVVAPLAKGAPAQSGPPQMAPPRGAPPQGAPPPSQQGATQGTPPQQEKEKDKASAGKAAWLSRQGAAPPAATNAPMVQGSM